MLNNLIFAAQVLALGVWAIFVLEYQILTRGDWRLTRSGRNIMGLGSLIILALGLITFAPDHPFSRVGQLVIALCVTYIGVERIRLLFEVQGRQRQREYYKGKSRPDAD